MMKIRYIANGITLLRILLSVCLVFFAPSSVPFLSIYIVCGISDVMDGYIARKTNTANKFGAALDSIADIIFFSILLFIFIPIIKLPANILLWIVGIAIVRFASLAAGFYKYHALALLHTYSNKAAGFAIFCFPILIIFFETTAVACFICVIASIAAAEDLVINITSRELLRDIKSVLGKR